MRILEFSAKCSDMFCASLTNNDKWVGSYNDYVPGWFPNPNVKHYGDYISLSIDIDTGQILNWKVPNEDELNETFKSNGFPE